MSRPAGQVNSRCAELSYRSRESAAVWLRCVPQL